MTAPTPEKCDICGASPVEVVLYPVAIHYKGSGFYTTDYGKGKGAKADGDSKGGETKSTETKSSDSKPSESKPSSSSTSSD